MTTHVQTTKSHSPIQMTKLIYKKDNNPVT